MPWQEFVVAVQKSISNSTGTNIVVQLHPRLQSIIGLWICFLYLFCCIFNLALFSGIEGWRPPSSYDVKIQQMCGLVWPIF